MTKTTSYAGASDEAEPSASWWRPPPELEARPLSPSDYAEASDQDLAALAGRGREGAFRALLTRYERPVFSLVFRMVRDRALAEDLAQEAFIRAFNAIDSYKPQYKFSNWILKIANNHAIDYLRKRKLDTISIHGAPGATSQEERKRT